MKTMNSLSGGKTSSYIAMKDWQKEILRKENIDMEKEYVNKLNNILNVSPREESTRELIMRVCADVEKLLLEKNDSYGDSALNPLGIFSDSDALVNLGARIDDKLARIKTMGFTGYGEDNVKDLTGYLILLQVELLKRK